MGDDLYPWDENNTPTNAPKGTYEWTFGEDNTPINKPAREADNSGTPAGAVDNSSEIIDPSTSAFKYGTYSNPATWNWKTRKLVKKTGADYIDIDDATGKMVVKHINPGASNLDLLKAKFNTQKDINRYQKDAEAVALAQKSGLNYTSKYTTDNPYLNQGYGFLANGANSIIYRQKQEAAQEAAQETAQEDSTPETEVSETLEPPAAKEELRYIVNPGLSDGWNTRNANILSAIAESGKDYSSLLGEEGFTKDSLEKWQTANGLVADGKLGYNSIGKLGELGLLTNDQVSTFRKGTINASTSNPATVDWTKEAEKAGFGIGLNSGDQNYANMLAARVKAFQYANKLNASGKVDKDTLAKISTPFTNDSFTNLNGYSIVNDKGTKTYYDNGRLALWDNTGKYWGTTSAKKLGGTLTMNKTKYFQAGGALNAQQVATEQAQAQQQQLTEIFQAIAAQPQEALDTLQKQGITPEQIIEMAQKMADSNPAAKEALLAIQKLAQFRKQGAKLTYIKLLRDEAPEGYEIEYFMAGGKACKRLKKATCGAKVEKDSYGKKMKKCAEGGDTKLVSEFKEMRCRGKAKKKC